MPSIIETIALSIKKADSTFFNENYTKQAKAVVEGLRKAGYEVVPVRPPDILVEYATDNLPMGRLRSSELVRALYTIMVENCKKFVG